MAEYTAHRPQDEGQGDSHLPKIVRKLKDTLADAQRGFAVSESSFERGISVVTAPVRNDTGRIVAVITTTIPRAEIDAWLLDSGLIDKVRHAADELSQRLNYRPKCGPGAGSKYMKALGL